ncbi:hypothetical protein O1M63_09200 [Streptomyces mirabilis]|nr:hypothetical protein [Streptomyces mirabilis]
MTAIPARRLRAARVAPKNSPKGYFDEAGSACINAFIYRCGVERCHTGEKVQERRVLREARDLALPKHGPH